jgi:hypothetical protein
MPDNILPEIDRDFLAEKGFNYTATDVGNSILVVLKEFAFPEAYNPRTADLLIVLPAGYPNANVDMFYTCPDVKLASGSWPLNCDGRVNYCGQEWQQWSRHFKVQWRQGVDSLRTFIASIRRELSKGI